MSYLVNRKTELTFKTASTITEAGKARSVVIESRPNYAVVKLSGTQVKYPIAWEHIFHLARNRHAENLRQEKRAAREVEQAKKAKDRPGPRRKPKQAIAIEDAA